MAGLIVMLKQLDSCNVMKYINLLIIYLAVPYVLTGGGDLLKVVTNEKGEAVGDVLTIIC